MPSAYVHIILQIFEDFLIFKIFNQKTWDFSSIQKIGSQTNLTDERV